MIETHARSLSLKLRVISEFVSPPIYAAWLYFLSRAPDSIAYRLLCFGPFRKLGDLSFAVYVLHMPVMLYYALIRLGPVAVSRIDDPAVMLSGFDGLHPAEYFPVVLLVYLISWIAYRYIEAPCRSRLSDLLAHQRSL